MWSTKFTEKPSSIHLMSDFNYFFFLFLFNIITEVRKLLLLVYFLFLVSYYSSNNIAVCKLKN